MVDSYGTDALGLAGADRCGRHHHFSAGAGNPKTLAPLGFFDKALESVFTLVSARSAGLNAIDFTAPTSESVALHYVLMFIDFGVVTLAMALATNQIKRSFRYPEAEMGERRTRP